MNLFGRNNELFLGVVCQELLWQCNNILLEGTLIVLCLVSVPTRSPLSGYHALAVPHALKSVKGPLICKFWERTQRAPEAYREGA